MYMSGIPNFAVCSNAGFIPYFDQHLTMFPNNDTSFMWPEREVTGNREQAKNDFNIEKEVHSLKNLMERCDTSFGSKGLLAREMVESHVVSQDAWAATSNRRIADYTRSAEAGGEFDSHSNYRNQHTEALPSSQKSNSLAVENNETKEPFHCWSNFSEGDILHKNVKTDPSAKSFQAAIDLCTAHTIQQIGLGKTNIVKGCDAAARGSFIPAKSLNPNSLHSAMFEDFRRAENPLENLSLADQMEKLPTLASQPSSSRQHSSSRILTPSEAGSTAAAKGGQDGSGGGGNGDGSGSDNDDDDEEKVWKRLRFESKCIAKYRGRVLVQSKDGKFWYSRDTARHGRAFVKVYDDKKNTLNFKGSYDKNMKLMSGKHESRKGTDIKKSDLDIISRK